MDLHLVGAILTILASSTYEKNVILLVYVDDIIIIRGNSIVITWVKANLGNEFDAKDLGQLRYFLDIEVARSRHGISLSQRVYCGCP